MDFSAVTLKKVSAHPETQKAADLKQVVESEKELNRRLIQADMDSWYDALVPYTYETVFVPLSVQEAEAMIAKYTSQYPSQILCEVENILGNLEAKVSQAMKEAFGEGQSVFAKLSSRSPKDATNRRPIKNQILVQLVEEKGIKPISKNDLLSCVFQAHISSFELKSGKEVLDTLLNSERVIMDELPLVLEHKQKIWKEQIVLRKWYSIPIQFELRGFVFNNKVVAISQYYDEVFYPELLQNKDMIANLILDFFETMKDKVPIDPKEYVLDLVVDIHTKKVLIVEINPFGKPDGMGTGTVMFDLKKPQDRKVLFGEGDFEFRLETQPTTEEAFKNMIGPELDAILSPYY